MTKVEIPVEIETTGAEKIKKARKEITEIKKSTKNKSPFKEEEKTPSSRKNVFDSFLTNDDSKLTDIEKKIAQIVKNTMSQHDIELKDVTKKDFQKIIYETEQKVNPKTSDGAIDKILEQDLGVGKAGNILNYATNPSGAVLQQLFKIGALPTALIGAPQVAAKVIDFLQQEGQLLDRFFDDTISNRTDALRDKHTQQAILQGFDSLRISTIDGSYDPRNVYNSFEVYENDRILLENDFKIRTDIS